MKVTNFGTDGLPVALAGPFTGVTAISSNAGVAGGLSGFVQRITANSSNTLQNPIINFAAGSGISLAAASNTITITSTPGGGAGTGGDELDYVQITAPVSLTATTEGTAHTIITGTSKAYAAAPIVIEVFSPDIEVENTAAAAVVILLFDGATVLGRLGLIITPASAVMRVTFHGSYRLTPTAATHQYIVKAYTTVATSVFSAGAGGTGAELPAFLRITRA